MQRLALSAVMDLVADLPFIAVPVAALLLCIHVPHPRAIYAPISGSR
jgi:hypothetical protein